MTILRSLQTLVHKDVTYPSKYFFRLAEISDYVPHYRYHSRTQSLETSKDATRESLGVQSFQCWLGDGFAGLDLCGETHISYNQLSLSKVRTGVSVLLMFYQESDHKRCELSTSCQTCRASSLVQIFFRTMLDKCRLHLPQSNLPVLRVYCTIYGILLNHVNFAIRVKHQRQIRRRHGSLHRRTYV